MVKIGQWLSEGWNLFAKDPVTFVLSSFLAVLGGLFTCTVLLVPLLFGVSYMALRSLRGEPFTVGDLGFGFQRVGKALLLWVINIGIGMLTAGASKANNAATLIHFVVGPYLMMLNVLVAYQIVDRDEDFGKAVSNVFDLFKKDWLMFWVCGLVFSVLEGIGSVACVIGIFVTLPWILCAGAVAYRDLVGLATPKAPAVSEPPKPEPPPAEPSAEPPAEPPAEPS